MRGVTYRSTVLPLWKDRVWHAVFYIGLLIVVDAALRRTGQLLASVGIPVFPSSGNVAMLLRIILLHAPFSVWAITGPLTRNQRDDSGWSAAATKSRFWFLFAKLFGHTRIVLSEEWCDLTPEQRSRWQERQYVIPMHPHGLLPFGAILNGLTWAGGGLRGITASGAELPEPKDPGSGLHQRWFRHMRLRAAVASGAANLFPLFFEMFKYLGGFECTKPFFQAVLRDGRDVAIFPGGAQESGYAAPGRYVCLCKKHKGFVRIAIEERRDLLPMWTFGDESLVPQMHFETLPQVAQSLQRWGKETLGLLVPPTLAGLPQLVPLTLVTGVPVSLEDLWPEQVGGEVSDAAVDEGHKRYMKAVTSLFDRNKGLVPGGHAKAVIEFL